MRMKSSSTRSELNFSWMVVTAVIYFLKIIGLAPFSVQTKKFGKNSKHKCARTFLTSKIGLAYNILLLILVTVCAGCSFPHLLSVSYKYQSSISRAIDISQGILCVSAVWIIIATWTSNQRKAAFVMNKIVDIDVKLSGSNRLQSFDNLTFRLLICTHVIINVSVWVAIVAMELVHPIISNVVVNWLLFSIPSFIIYWFIVEYFLIVGLLARRLGTVNKNLSEFKDSWNKLISCPFLLNDSPAGWSLSMHNQLDVLYVLRSIRTILFDLSQDIAQFFSFPILACITYSFVSFASNVYYLIEIFVLSNAEIALIETASTVAWLFINLYPLTVLFFNVTETVTEAKLTGRIVHKLLSSAVRGEIKTELEFFSLQLLHEHINFTAYGFFTLDFTLLHSMLGATATYIIILIQFE